MKFKKITYIFFVLSIFLYGNIYSQSVNITDMQYINGTTISSGSPIEIPANGNSQIDFAINLNNPSGIEGTLTVYTKKDINSLPSQKGGSETVFSGTTSFLSSRNLTLYGDFFYATGGYLYAEFVTVSGIIKTSNIYDIEHSGNGNGGNGNIPRPTHNQITSGQFLSPGDTAGIIDGRPARGGVAPYSYRWYVRSLTNSNNWWPADGNSHGQDYQPPTPSVGTNRVYRRQAISAGGTTFLWSNNHFITWVNNTANGENTITGSQTVEVGEIGFDIVGSHPISNARRTKWLYSYNRINWSSTGLLGAESIPCANWYRPNGDYNQVTYYLMRQVTYFDNTIVNSNVVNITVAFGNNFIIYDSNSCVINGSIPEGAHGIDSFAYQWYQRSLGGNWSRITNATNSSYSPINCNPNETIQYKRVTKSHRPPNIWGSPLVGTNVNSKGLDVPGFNSNFVEIVGTNPLGEDETSFLKVFPNPTKNGVISIYAQTNELHNGVMNIEVYDSYGAKVFYNQLRMEQKSTLNGLDLSHLEKGVYFVKLLINNNTSIKKLIIN